MYNLCHTLYLFASFLTAPHIVEDALLKNVFTCASVYLYIHIY